MFIKIGVPFLMAACLSCASREEGLHCTAMAVDDGYGYIVLYKQDTLIYQPYIPVVGKKKAFSTEEDALKVGRLVCRKLAKRQSPAISRDEIRLAGVELK